MSPPTHTEIKPKQVESPVEEQPKRFKVLLLNDHYTTMEFVVMILLEVFHKTREEAVTIMLHVHRQGQGVAGIYTYEIAEMKCLKVHQSARRNGFPLRCVIEPE